MTIQQQEEAFEGYQQVIIKIKVPKIFVDQIKKWLAGDEPKTETGMGIGVMKKCKLL